MSRDDAAPHPWRLLALCLAAGAALSAASRSDANWDLQNYHLYAPFAAWTHRLGLDYFAAGFQGYLNPVADLPYFIAKMILFPGHPAMVAALSGLPFGLLAFLTIRIADLLLPPMEDEAPAPGLARFGLRWTSLLAAATGLTGATTLSEIGTTYGDLEMADAVLLGLFGALKFWPSTWRAAAALGFGIGCAAGLKLTALIFAPAAMVLLLTGAPDRRGAALRLACLAGAAAAGFLLLWGWWGAALWQHFRNPVFPLFGRLFPSSWPVDFPLRDTRFFPRSVLQWIAYPFFWLQGRSFVATELSLRDPRFALCYLALLAAGLRALLPSRLPSGRPIPDRPMLDRRVLGLWLFAAAAYPCWLIGFSILRYALPLEALSGIVLATVLRHVLPRPWLAPGSGRLRSWRVPALLLAVCVAATKPMGWGRIGYNRDLVEAPIPVLPENAVVFIVGAPLGFVIPYVATPGTRFIRPDFLAVGSPETAIIRDLAGQGAPLFVLTNQPADAAGAQSIAAALAPLGLSPSDRDCRPIRSPLQPAIRLCSISVNR